VLSDEEKRKQYDQYGRYFGGQTPPGRAAFLGGAGFPGGGYQYQNVDLGDLGDLGDLFNNIFGGGTTTTRKSAHRGRDLQYDVTLTFEEALSGTSTKVDVKRSERVLPAMARALGRGQAVQPVRPVMEAGMCRKDKVLLGSRGRASVVVARGRSLSRHVRHAGVRAVL